MDKVYKIRKKSTGEFIAFGNAGRCVWKNNPIKNFRNEYGLSSREYELVIFELKEINSEQI